MSKRLQALLAVLALSATAASYAQTAPSPAPASPAPTAPTAPVAAPAPATPQTTLGLIFGVTAPPPADAGVLVDASQIMPSRAVGGEMIDVMIPNGKNVTGIALNAYSASGTGKILIHRLGVVLADGTMQPMGAEDAMLSPGQVIQSPVGPTAAGVVIREVVLQAEGYTSDDATLAVEVFSDAPWAPTEFQISRTPAPSGDVNGGWHHWHGGWDHGGGWGGNGGGWGGGWHHGGWGGWHHWH